MTSRSDGIRVSVSIVSHGHGLLVENLLADLRSQTIASSIEVILTRNLQGEEIAWDVPDETLGAMRIVDNPVSRGFGANHNSAAQHATGELLVICNPDISIPDSNLMNALIGHVESRKFDLAAPRVCRPDGGTEDHVRNNLTPWSLLVRHLTRHGKKAALLGRTFQWYAGMFLIIRRAAYDRLGGFDERFFLYCEDYDLCARAYLSGMASGYVSDCVVVHDARRDSRKSLRHLRWHLSSLFRVWCSSTFWRLTLGRWVGRGGSRPRREV